MPGDDWWTGSPSGGLERALAMGAPPPPGTMPVEMENAYRMAPAERDPLTWHQDQPAPGTTRGELVAGWQRRAAQQPQPAPVARMGPQRRRRRLTMKDAGDALASWEQDEYAQLNRSSGIT